MMDSILTMISPSLPGQRSAPVERVAAEAGSELVTAREPSAALVTEAKLADAVEKINDFIQIARSDLVFSVDEHTGRTVVAVVDAQTQEVIRQIPSEEVLAIAARLDEARGLLFEGKA